MDYIKGNENSVIIYSLSLAVVIFFLWNTEGESLKRDLISG